MNNGKVHPSRAFSFLFRSKIAFTSARTPPSSWEQSQGFADQVPSLVFRPLPVKHGRRGLLWMSIELLLRDVKSSFQGWHKNPHATSDPLCNFNLSSAGQMATNNRYVSQTENKRRTSVLICVSTQDSRSRIILLASYLLKTFIFYVIGWFVILSIKWYCQKLHVFLKLKCTEATINNAFVNTEIRKKNNLFNNPWSCFQCHTKSSFKNRTFRKSDPDHRDHRTSHVRQVFSDEYTRC